MPTHHRTDDAAIVARLEAALRRRGSLKSVTNAMRLANGPGDGLPGLILERYNQHFCAQVFDPGWSKRASLLLGFLKANFDPVYLIVKDRAKSSSSRPDQIETRVVIDKGQGSQAIVEEHGLRFAVDLNDGLNAGLFLDMRANRHTIAQRAVGRRMLNCFAYTCAFGVHAASQGTRVVNVDISKKALDRGRHNYNLNGLTVSVEDFVQADTQAYLQRAVKKTNCFDVIVLDPPSFARAGKEVFQVKRDLPSLISNTVQVLNPGGTLFVSTNSSAIEYTDVQAMVSKALKGRTIKKVTRLSQDADFPGTNTFKESHLVGICAEI